MALPSITLTGNLVADPELKYITGGTAQVRFRVACSERRKTADGTWEDGDTTFLSVTAWRTYAENVAETLTKGDSVTVTGRLKAREVEGKDGNRITYFDVDADSVSADLRRASGRMTRSGAGSSSTTPTVSDPWGETTTASDAPF